MYKTVLCVYKTMRVVITGAAGFIGHHLVEHLLRNTSYDIIILDKLSYASMRFKRLEDNGTMFSPRVRVFTYDLVSPLSVGLIQEMGDVEIIIHLAAETHVDNSISNPVETIRNNVMSTVNLLEWARTLPHLKKFFYFSTDEVFGNACHGESFKEWDRHKPTNPYSASKAASEDICLGYENTYHVPVLILNSMNVFGERQHVEKFIPKVIRNVRDGKETEIHCEQDCKTSGSRFYIHARNVASAILFLMEKGVVGEKYNISGEREVSNLDMLLLITKIMGKEPNYKLVNWHTTSRAGHDTRYCLDGSKLHEMGWKPPVGFEQTLEKTIRWTLENPRWLQEEL